MSKRVKLFVDYVNAIHTIVDKASGAGKNTLKVVSEYANGVSSIIVTLNIPAYPAIDSCLMCKSLTSLKIYHYNSKDRDAKNIGDIAEFITRIKSELRVMGWNNAVSINLQKEPLSNAFLSELESKLNKGGIVIYTGAVKKDTGISSSAKEPKNAVTKPVIWKGTAAPKPKVEVSYDEREPESLERCDDDTRLLNEVIIKRNAYIETLKAREAKNGQ